MKMEVCVWFFFPWIDNNMLNQNFLFPLKASALSGRFFCDRVLFVHLLFMLYDVLRE